MDNFYRCIANSVRNLWNTTDSTRNITCGTPQGATLSSLIFVMYINGIFQWKICFPGGTTESVNSFTYLGLIINGKLSWIFHIAHVCKKNCCFYWNSQTNSIFANKRNDDVALSAKIQTRKTNTIRILSHSAYNENMSTEM